MLDTLRRVETPEGVELSLAVAGPVSRAWAKSRWARFFLAAGAAIALTLAAAFSAPAAASKLPLRSLNSTKDLSTQGVLGRNALASSR